jgi:hypothetical protein
VVEEAVRTEEFVGLILTAAMLGVATGASFTAVIAVYRERSTSQRTRRCDAFAAWLAARKGLSRASASFVAAFRALALEKPESVHLPLRREEAQRARAAWCDAARELDRAEAMLLLWSGDPRTREDLARFERPAVERLRAAIDGDARRANALLEQIRDTDDRATEFARTAAAKAMGSRKPGRVRTARRSLAMVIHSWSRG